jgi:choline dehydrogenase-like flavoprotein
MGEPGAGVVDADLRFHGLANLYACDNSVFPASPAANPSLTTVALAVRLAAHLAG